MQVTRHATSPRATTTTTSRSVSWTRPPRCDTHDHQHVVLRLSQFHAESHTDRLVILPGVSPTASLPVKAMECATSSATQLAAASTAVTAPAREAHSPHARRPAVARLPGTGGSPRASLRAASASATALTGADPCTCTQSTILLECTDEFVRSLRSTWADISWCMTTAECAGVGGAWNPVHSSCEPACSVDFAFLCVSESSCVALPGGSWMFGACDICSGANPWSCATEEACAGAGPLAGWHPSFLYCDLAADINIEPCTNDALWNCYTEQNCTQVEVGGVFNMTAAGVPVCVPGCNSVSPWGCTTYESCVAVSGNGWHTGYLYCDLDSNIVIDPCTVEARWNCFTADGCSGVSGVFSMQDGFAICDPPCGRAEPWGCKNETNCVAVSGLAWHPGYMYCDMTDNIVVEPCTADAVWNCFVESDCIDAGGQFSRDNDGMPICDPFCGTAVPWSCSTQELCVAVEGLGWHPLWNYCDLAENLDLGVCSADRLDYCYNEVDCTGVAGQWTSMPGGQGYCEPGCSLANVYSCTTTELCSGVGGTWTFHRRAQTGVADMHGMEGMTGMAGMAGMEESMPSGHCVPPCSALSPWTCTSEDACLSHAPLLGWHSRWEYCDLAENMVECSTATV